MRNFPQHEKGNYFRHLPCPDCHSSDALALYPWDGGTHCFSCDKSTFNKYKINDTKTGVINLENGEEYISELSNGILEFDKSVVSIVAAPLYARKITKESCEKYGVKSEIDQDGNLVRIQFPYYSFSGERVATKFNVLATETKKKQFWSTGKMDEATLFGMTKFSSGLGRYVCITEGELDCMSAYQMFGSKYAVVSLRNGAQSVKKSFSDVQVYDWLNSFERIVISFDNDEAGKDAIKEITSLFPPEKIHVMNMAYKDANEYLMKGKQEEFIREFWAAKPTILDGIKNLSESREHALKPANVEKIDYPWKKLNELTRGIRMGEATTILSGTGQGKTTLMQELVWHLLQDTDFKIGCMFIENSERDTVNNIVGTAMSYPIRFALENNDTLDQAIFEYDAKHGSGAFIKARDEAMKETVDSGRLWSIADTDYTVNNMEKVLSRCRYFAKVLGCKVIFLDHISLLVAGGDYEGDERKVLDEIATKLAMIVKELNIHLFIVTQANTPTGKALEEGGKTSVNGVRGTRGVGHITHNMIGIERNGQSDDPDERNTTLLRVLKCRWTGRTGPASSLMFSHETYRMLEVFPEDPQSNPEGLKLADDKPIMDTMLGSNITHFPRDM